uniref:EH domain-containing protein n=1 Tax=Anolis carolinensis TaxID=28377 RepID=A0A803T3R4_ANOCA
MLSSSIPSEQLRCILLRDGCSRVITGANAKKEMVKSKLPNTVLGKIWKLADVDKDGLLDDEEFALANHLIKVKLEGHELPAELPPHLVPPSKRRHE